jgi:dUTP pyrophosphatase
LINIEIEKLKHAEDIPLPSYSSDNCSGLDLCAAIKKNENIKSGQIKTIPTGIKISLKKNLEAQVRPRSGLAKDFGVTVLNSPGTIDSDYRGEIKIILINHGKKDFIVKKAMRIAQLVIAKIERIEWIEKKRLTTSTKRNESGFGSTGL